MSGFLQMNHTTSSFFLLSSFKLGPFKMNIFCILKSVCVMKCVNQIDSLQIDYSHHILVELKKPKTPFNHCEVKNEISHAGQVDKYQFCWLVTRAAPLQAGSSKLRQWYFDQFEICQAPATCALPAALAEITPDSNFCPSRGLIGSEEFSQV